MKEQFCPQCGQPRQKNFKFCTTCGFDFRNYASSHMVEEVMNTPILVHPWWRFWARILDSTVISIAFSFLLGMLYPRFLEIERTFNFWQIMAYMLVFILFSILIESAFISYTGTTPGKALFKIRVQNQNGTNLSFGKSMDRSCLAYMKGMAIGFFPISLIFEWRSKRILEKEGITQWDAALKTVVQHGAVGRIVYFYFVLITIFLIFLDGVLQRMIS